MKNNFIRALRSFLCLSLVSASGFVFAQSAGRVVASLGDVTLVRQGAAQPALVGTALLEGDTLRTGAIGNAQVMFSDSSIVALRASTEFVVREYKFDGARGNLAFDLLKGGMRTLTGLIGKTPPSSNYRVNARIATVGVRGTNYSLVLCQDDCTDSDGSRVSNGLYGGVFDGRIGVANNTPEVLFARDEYFFVADLNSVPQPLVGPPSFLADRLASLAKNSAKPASEPAATVAVASTAAAASGSTATDAAVPPPPATAYTANNNLGSGGVPVAVGNANTVGFLAAFSLIEANGSHASYGQGALAPSRELTVNGVGAGQTLTAFSLTQDPISGAVGPGGIDMTGFDPASGMYYGRWVNGTITQAVNVPFLPAGTQTPGTGVHYLVVGSSFTPDTVLASRTGTFQYVDYAGTTPTSSTGAIASSFAFGPININFTNRTGTLTSVSMTFPNSTWSFSNLGFSLDFSQGLVSFNSNLINSGSCVGAACGANQGPNTARADFGGAIVGKTGNFLAMNFHGNSNAQQLGPNITTSVVRIFKCPTCP